MNIISKWDDHTFKICKYNMVAVQISETVAT